jgi:hypothetical protein
VEAKALYGAVKIQPQWVVTPEKQTTTINYLCLMRGGNFGRIWDFEIGAPLPNYRQENDSFKQ